MSFIENLKESVNDAKKDGTDFKTAIKVIAVATVVTEKKR